VHELQLTQNDYWLTALLNTYQNNDQPSEISNNDKLLNKLTPASLQKSAQKYLTESNVLKFELLPEKK
jgi:zinc protease